MTQVQLSIITVNYGTAEKVLELYKSLQAFPPTGTWEFIVVDNNAPGNDADTLQQALGGQPNVQVLHMPHNVGFGLANEAGVRASKGGMVALINPDIQVREGTFVPLLRVLEEEEHAGIVVPQLLNEDDTPQPNTRNFPTFWGLMLHRLFGVEGSTQEYLKQGGQKSVEPHPVPWAQGSFWVLRREFFDLLGGFDDQFFLFFEDTDLCRRCWEAGHRVLLVPQSTAYHGHQRLSGGAVWTAIWKKTFWIHIVSALKYFWKYKWRRRPKIY